MKRRRKARTPLIARISHFEENNEEAQEEAHTMTL